MTPVEFKAWFDGYLACMRGEAPTPEQWKQVVEKVAALEAAPIAPPPIFPMPKLDDPYRTPDTAPPFQWPYVVSGATGIDPHPAIGGDGI